MDQVVEMEEATHQPRGRGRSSNGQLTNVVVLGPRDSLSGSLTVDGDVRLEGSVEGEVRATGDIDVESSSTARARLEGRNVSVRGNVTGNIVASHKLSVAGSGSVSGDVQTARLRVDDGATVNGSISMRSGSESGQSG
ncbi:MAG: polymer-forming cytoskeletal protein [Chloroflexi bacterium]|nr:polymer-forming cytoskeletal protein [Chloroflexota bacterium]